jgi:hypothetical protein
MQCFGSESGFQPKYRTGSGETNQCEYRRPWITRDFSNFSHSSGTVYHAVLFFEALSPYVTERLQYLISHGQILKCNVVSYTGTPGEGDYLPFLSGLLRNVRKMASWKQINLPNPVAMTVSSKAVPWSREKIFKTTKLKERNGFSSLNYRTTEKCTNHKT